MLTQWWNGNGVGAQAVAPSGVQNVDGILNGYDWFIDESNLQLPEFFRRLLR